MSLLNLKGHTISPNFLVELNKAYTEQGSGIAFGMTIEHGFNFTKEEFYSVLRRDPNTGNPLRYTPDQMTYQVGWMLSGLNDAKALAKATEFGFDFENADDLRAACTMAIHPVQKSNEATPA